jgi:hypothetical protein
MAVKQLGKKGMFLTFIAISLIAALIVIFTPSDINLSGDVQAIKTRVSNVNEYVSDLESVYLENALKATGRRTIIALIKYMEAKTMFLTSFDDAFSEVLLDGTIGGILIDDIIDPDIMTDNTYNDLINEIKTTAEQTFNVDTVYDISDIRVYQTRPWFIEVEADIIFSVTSETASWTRDVIIKTEISVENFDDPYYLVNTEGSYINKITKSDTKFDEWDVDKVIDFIGNGDYTHFEDSQAPSFLMRFYNDISASSCCGIESLVNPNNDAILSKFASYVDYLYWKTPSDCDNQNLYKVNGLNSEIKLDFGSIGRYNLLAGAEKICPSEG